MRKALIAALCLLGVNVSNADEISVVGHGLAKHIHNENFNEKPYGLGLRYEANDFGLQIGGYRNSFYKDTFYFGIDWNVFQSNKNGCFSFEAGPFYGLATGYKYDVMPMVGLQSAIKCDNVFVRFRAIPDFVFNSKAVGSVELGIVVKKF